MASNEKSAVPSPDSTPPHGEVERLLAELREANERLVLAGVQLQELSEQAETGRLQADAARVDAEMAAEQLQIALEGGRMGTWQYTMSTGAVRWSSGLEAIHGYAPGSFAGTFEAFRNEIHPADRDRVLEAIGTAVELRRDHHIEYRIVRSDGTERWVEGRGQLFYDQDGRPERMVGVCLDVTERKHAEDKFRLAVEAAPAAMIMVDPGGTIVLVNALTEQLLGFARHEIVGQPLDYLVPPRFRDRHPEYRKSFFADPRQRAMGAGRELYALRKDGSEVPVEIGLSPLDTADGRFVLAAVTDVSERKRTVAALRQSEARKTAIFQTALDCIISIDHQGNIVEFNSAAERMFGYRQEEVVGRGIAELIIPPSLRDSHRQGMAHYLATREGPILDQRIEMPAVRAGGEEFPVELAVTRIPTDGPPLFTAYLRDITERKRAQALLSSQNQALEEAVRARDEFLSMASHELRNPINALQLRLVSVLREADRYSESLPRQWVTQRVGQARDQVARLERLVGHLLDVTRIRAGRLDLELEDLDFSSIVQAAVDRVRGELKDRDVILRLSPVSGRSDRLRLDQIVTNLFSNAVKYGEGKPIEVLLEPEGDTVRLSVTDHGIGIAQENQKRLFEPFERAVSRRQYGGFGLGLWITRQIVDAMRGHISVDSRPGQGSTFSVVVPRTLSLTPSNKPAEARVT